MKFVFDIEFDYKDFIIKLHEYGWEPDTCKSAGDAVIWRKGKYCLLTIDPTYPDYYDKMCEAIQTFISVEKLELPTQFSITEDRKSFAMKIKFN